MYIYIFDSNFLSEADLINLKELLDFSSCENSLLKKNKLFYKQIILSYIFKKHLNLEYNENLFHFNKYGKPYLKSYDNFYFNLSYSENIVTCGISSREIGIDIEKIKNINFKKITNLFFTKHENNYILNSSDKLKCFFKLWTLKESYLKYTGKGLGILNDVSIKIGDKKNIKVLENNNTQDLDLRTFISRSEYIISICSEIKVTDYKLVYIDKYTLIDTLRKGKI